MGKFAVLDDAARALRGAARGAIPGIDEALEGLSKSGKYTAKQLDETRARWESGESTYVPRPRNKGSATGPLLIGDDGRGFDSTAEFNQEVIDAAKKAQESPLRKKNPDIVTNEVGEPRYTEAVDELPESTGNREGNQVIANKDRTKIEVAEFRQAWGKAKLGPFAHHHILDFEWIGAVLNRVDAPQIVEELKRFGIDVGDRARNIIGAMDQKTAYSRASTKDSIVAQMDWGINRWQDATKEQERLLNDLLKKPKTKDADFGELVKGKRDELTGELTPPETLKRGADDKNPLLETADWESPGDPQSYGLPRGKSLGSNRYKLADTWPEGTTQTPWGTKVDPDLKVTTAHRREAYQNRWATNNIKRSNIKIDPRGTILAKDHIDIIHDAYNSPKFTAKRDIEALLESGEWRRLSPRQAAEKIAAVYQIQRNIVLNVSKTRLKRIKAHLNKSHQGQLRIRQGPESIREWILENSAKAANLGWGEALPSFEKLIRDPGAITDELRIIFATELENLQDLQAFAESFSSQL